MESNRMNLISAGGQLANIAYNLAQRAGQQLSAADAALLDAARTKWGEARHAPAAPTVPVLALNSAYQSNQLGSMTYIGDDVFHGQFSHKFRTAHGEKYILPEALARHFTPAAQPEAKAAPAETEGTLQDERAAALADADQVPYLIVYDDADQRPEPVIGGARARYRFKQISSAWNAHLYVKIESNSRDEKYPSAHMAPSQPGAEKVMDTPAHLVVGTAISDSVLTIAVHVKRGDRTTVVYTKQHPLNGDTVGVEALPDDLFAESAATPAAPVNQPAAQEPYAYALEANDGHITFFKSNPSTYRHASWHGLMTVRDLYTAPRPALAGREQAVAKAADDARAVFKDSCNHTMQVIDYMEQVMLADDAALAAQQGQSK